MEGNKHIGDSFDSFLEQEGVREEAHTEATKRVLAWQIQAAMKEQSISKAEMARRMRTSRTQLERLLDPTNDKVQIDTIEKAAAILGRKLILELV
jgi:antitoxin HicB